MKMACADCSCSFEECVESMSSTDCPHCSLSKCCCWNVIHANHKHISNSSEREMRLLTLRRTLGHGIHDDFRIAADRLADILNRDFEREMALAVGFIERNNHTKAAAHRAMANAIHNTLRDLEMMTG
jgi:hypothetical protein